MHKPGRRGPIRTSDHIADDLISLLTNPSDPRIGNDWLLAAQEFKRLVKVRNSIFHGQPGSTPTGEQRLFREGIPWTPETVDNAVAEFEACSHILRDTTITSGRDPQVGAARGSLRYRTIRMS
jgi:hypothetical protein